HGLDQPGCHANGRVPLWRREGFGLRQRRRPGSHGGIPELQGGVDHGRLKTVQGPVRRPWSQKSKSADLLFFGGSTLRWGQIQDAASASRSRRLGRPKAIAPSAPCTSAYTP